MTRKSKTVPAGIPFSEAYDRIMQDPEMQELERETQFEYELTRQIIASRIEQNLSQADLAARIGTRQSNISRLENGNLNNSVQFLKRVADGLGKELHIELR